MKKIPQPIKVLGLVSFFTDLSGEMIYPLLPVFLSQVLGAGTMVLGVIEGVAEATASLVKIFSGIWADRIGKRKPLIVMGYGLSGFSRPWIGIAAGWKFVLLVRFFDRVGKGIRSAPRDALIADVADPKSRGAAYGFHRAMDNAGAVFGPIAAALLLLIPGMDLRKVFFATAIPAIVAFSILVFFLKDQDRRADELSTAPLSELLGDWRKFGSEFKFLLLALFVFTLGNSADAFLLVRLNKAGIPAAGVALLWSVHNAVRMISTYYGGRWADHLGRRSMIVAGWALFGLIYLGFGMAQRPSLLVALFLAYGLHFGFVEPAERAWIADLAPPKLRGTAFGYYHFMIGLGALPASILFGSIWQVWGPATAFQVGAALSLTATVMVLFVPLRSGR